MLILILGGFLAGQDFDAISVDYIGHRVLLGCRSNWVLSRADPRLYLSGPSFSITFSIKID